MDALTVFVILLAIISFLIAPRVVALLVSIYGVMGIRTSPTGERVFVWFFRLVSVIILVIVLGDAAFGSSG